MVYSWRSSRSSVDRAVASEAMCAGSIPVGNAFSLFFLVCKICRRYIDNPHSILYACATREYVGGIREWHLIHHPIQTVHRHRHRHNIISRNNKRCHNQRFLSRPLPLLLLRPHLCSPLSRLVNRGPSRLSHNLLSNSGSSILSLSE